jgi:DNA modification methylase
MTTPDNKSVMLDINDLVPWDQNPRINDGSVDAVALSIKEFGWTNPILARSEDLMVIAGHTRLKAAKQLGLENVPVRFLDVTKAQAKQIAIADNKLGELALWDEKKLSEVLSEFELEELGVLGFDEDELEKLIEDDIELVDENDAPEIQEIVYSYPGTVYELGPHRLMCGDSTSNEDVKTLANGNLVDLLLTDPPYGVDYADERTRHPEGRQILNDNLKGEEFYQFLYKVFENASSIMKDGASYYVWIGERGRLGLDFRRAIIDNDFHLAQSLVWVKNDFPLSRQDYHWLYEPCLYGWKPGAGHKWYNDRKQTNVLRFDRPQKSKEHPMMKPIPLFEYQLKNNTKKGDIVLDLFGGSGTAIIASALNNRICYSMEMDPAYCDVIRRRWTKFANENGLDAGSGAL